MTQVILARRGPARVSATILLTVAEQFHAMLQLVDSTCAAHAAGPIRSMLEGVTDLIILGKDPSYVDQLAFDNAKAVAMVLERYLAGLGEAFDMNSEMGTMLREMLHLATTTRDRLKADGKKRQTREDKFALIGLEDLYIAYGVLYSLVHPNLTALMARHVGQKFELNYRSTPDPEVIAMLMSIGIRVLVQAMRSGLFLTASGTPFLFTKRHTSSGKISYSCESMTAIIRHLHHPAGIEGGSASAACRTFAVQLRRNGTDLDTIRRLLGLSSLSAIKRIVDGDPVRLGTIVARII